MTQTAGVGSSPGTIGPDALGPDALGPDALGPGAFGPSALSKDFPLAELFVALDAARIGYAVTDPDGRGLFVSAAYAKLMGSEAHLMVGGEPWFTLDHADEAEKAERARLWAAFQAMGQTWRGWVRWCASDGTVRYFEGTAHPLADRRVILIGNDRSEEREANRAVEDAADLQRHILDDLPVAVVLQDKDGEILYCNRLVPDRMGIAISDVIGKHPRDVPFIGLDRGLMALIGEARTRGKTIDGTPVSIRRGGLAGTHWLFYGRPLHNRSGEFKQFLSIGVDRTASAALDTEREAFAKALAETQKIGALNDFAGSLAHELSNILHPVGVYGRALAADPDHPDRQVLAEKIRTAAMTAGRILRRTLTMARTDAAPPATHDVAKIVDEVVASARDLAPKTLTYTLERPAAPVLAMTQPTELRQVLLNLFNNAADAQHHQGTIAVVVAEGRSPPPTMPVLSGSRDRFVSVSVRDEGTGMSMEARARIFEAFYTTKKGGKGTGLGLPLVQGLVTGWGGAVSVESTPDVGSTFTVWIPQPMVDSSASSTQAHDGRGPDEEREDGS